MTYQTGFETTIAFRVEPTDTTIKLATAPTATNGRIYIFNNAQEEWVSYTGVSWTTITWVTRWLSKTADPASAWAGLTWIAWTTVRLVAMHDQMPDKKDNNTFTSTQTFTTVNFWSDGKFSVPVYTTTTTRDTSIPSPTNWMVVYVTADWSFYKYEWWSRTTFASGSVPNATTTVAGKVELWTVAEGKAWTSTWWSWPLVLQPNVIADIIQSWAWLYSWASATWTDTYVVSMTPACTAYVTGMQIVFKADVANTWACTININGLGAKSIKNQSWNDLSDSQIKANQTVKLTYDGTKFVYDVIADLATNAEAAAWTIMSKAITPKQLKDNIIVQNWTTNMQSTTVASWIWISWSWWANIDQTSWNLIVIQNTIALIYMTWFSSWSFYSTASLEYSPDWTSRSTLYDRVINWDSFPVWLKIWQYRWRVTVINSSWSSQATPSATQVKIISTIL